MFWRQLPTVFTIVQLLVSKRSAFLFSIIFFYGFDRFHCEGKNFFNIFISRPLPVPLASVESPLKLTVILQSCHRSFPLSSKALLNSIASLKKKSQRLIFKVVLLQFLETPNTKYNAIFIWFLLKCKLSFFTGSRDHRKGVFLIIFLSFSQKNWIWTRFTVAIWGNKN